MHWQALMRIESVPCVSILQARPSTKFGDGPMAECIALAGAGTISPFTLGNTCRTNPLHPACLYCLLLSAKFQV